MEQELIAEVVRLGFPRELGEQIAKNLRTENMMGRMYRYLRRVKPRSAEEMVDEMLAIMEDRERWTQKKLSEYYNRRLYGSLARLEEDAEGEDE